MSSVTGNGFKEFLEAVEGSREEYEKFVPLPFLPFPSLSHILLLHSHSQPTHHRDYLPELEAARAQREKTLQAAKDESMARVLKDLAIDREKNPKGALADRWEEEEEEEDEDADDEGELDTIDRCMCRFFLFEGLVLATL